MASLLVWCYPPCDCLAGLNSLAVREAPRCRDGLGAFRWPSTPRRALAAQRPSTVSARPRSVVDFGPPCAGRVYGTRNLNRVAIGSAPSSLWLDCYLGKM